MPAKPKPAFPNPAATLPGEADVLANVLADLSDDHAKLVYADWLEDRDDPRGPLLRKFVTSYRAGKKLPAVKSAPQPWRDLVGITLMETLRHTDIAGKTDRLLGLARPSIAYKITKSAEKTLPIGGSKFGGCPDLPANTKWPMFQKAPLAFIGQFNLCELQLSPVCRELPAVGVLSVFAAYDDESGNDDFPKGSWRLFYFPEASELIRHEVADALPDEARFPSCRLSFTEVLTLPTPDSPWEKELWKDGLGDGDEDDEYCDLCIDLDPGDHLLGYPYPIQGDILHKKSVRHLLTISGGGPTGWEWGDGGALYFTINESNLHAHNFDHVRMEMNCA